MRLCIWIHLRLWGHLLYPQGIRNINSLEKGEETSCKTCVIEIFASADNVNWWWLSKHLKNDRVSNVTRFLQASIKRMLKCFHLNYTSMEHSWGFYKLIFPLRTTIAPEPFRAITQHRNIRFSKIAMWQKVEKKVGNNNVAELAFFAFLMIQVIEDCFLIFGHICSV